MGQKLPRCPVSAPGQRAEHTCGAPVGAELSRRNLATLNTIEGLITVGVSRWDPTCACRPPFPACVM